MIRTREYRSEVAGPHFLVLGAIHGNEVCGANALEKLAGELEDGTRTLQRGRLTLIPICNEEAYRAQKRFVTENLNRVFLQHPETESLNHERRLANVLTPYVDRCDFMLDLHSMQSKGEPFVFLNKTTPESEALCRALGMRWIVKGWPELYAQHPEHLSFCTQTYADRMRKPNALIECGTNGAPEADAVAFEATLRAMVHLGLLKADPPASAENPVFLRLTDVEFKQAEGDRFVKVWKNFEDVRQGDLIGYREADLVEVRCPRDGVIVFPSPISAVGTEWFYVAVRE